MATTTNEVKITLQLSDGTSGVILLPVAPINATLTDEDTGEELHPAAFTAIQAAYETDGGATVKSATFEIIKTTRMVIASNYKGT